MQSTMTTSKAQRLSRLALLYQQGQASELMDRTLDKLLSLEAQKSSEQLDQLQADLAEFEARYGMSWEEFYTLFQAGKTDDRMDFVEWASLVQMGENLRHRLRLLIGEEPA